MRRRLLCIGMIVAVCLGGMAYQADAAPKSKNAKDSEVQVALGKLRGKLLYRKNQIHKLEKSACESNPQLKAKMDAMEKDRRTQYIAVEPKLEELYKLKDDLEKEIKEMTEKAEHNAEQKTEQKSE
ncbi:MAG: hypothetical protein J5833_07290 [Victivallales bacterium]|nr:hypothetical protein [Victivallales bacterium]